MPSLSLSCLSGYCAVSLPPISFIFASCLPFIIHGLPFYSRHKDFMPKGSLTVATNCRYCNKPHGMKQERKHTRHGCQESFPITPAASLFRPSVIIGKPFSLYSTSSLPCGIAPMAQFHTHPFLVVILCSSTYSHFISSIVFAASDIFRKGTSCMANAKLGSWMLFKKSSSMCLAYRAYFSLPICLFAFQLLCVAEKYPLGKPKGFRK